MIAPPEHPFFLKVLDTLIDIDKEDICKNHEWMHTICKTGSFAYGRAFTEFFGYKHSKNYPPMTPEDFYERDII